MHHKKCRAVIRTDAEYTSVVPVNLEHNNASDENKLERQSFNSLSNDKILDWSKFKQIADDI